MDSGVSRKGRPGLSVAAHALQIGGRQAVGAGVSRSRIKHLRQIDHGVPAHREGESRLALAGSFAVGDQQGARVQDRGEGAKPGLVVVLRAKIAHHRIGNVAFENFGRPALPIAQKEFERVEFARAGVAPQKFGGRGRRTGARVEQDDIDLAPRKSLVDHRQIAQHQSEEAEAQAAFDDGEDALELRVRRDVAEAQREERGAAQIDAGLEARDAWDRNASRCSTAGRSPKSAASPRR